MKRIPPNYVRLDNIKNNQILNKRIQPCWSIHLPLTDITFPGSDVFCLFIDLFSFTICSLLTLALFLTFFLNV